MKPTWKKGLLTCSAALLLQTGAPVFDGGGAAEAFGSPLAEIRQSADKWAIVPQRGGPPIIDGVADESSWTGAAVLNNFQTAYYAHSLGQEIEYRLFYDEQNLYVTGHLTEEEYEHLQRIEIVIRPDGANAPFYVAGIPVKTSPNPAIQTVWNPELDNIHSTSDIDRINLPPVTYASASSANGWTFEAALPLADIGNSPPIEGDAWQFTIVHLPDLYTLPLRSWVSIRNSDHWDTGGPTARLNGELVAQDRFGTLYFGHPPASLVSTSQTATRWTWTEEPELHYESPTSKRLLLSETQSVAAADLQVLWREPNGKAQQLTGWSIDQQSGIVDIVFDHPLMRGDGLYELTLLWTPAPGTETKLAHVTIDREDAIAAGEAAYVHPAPGVTPTPVANVPVSPGAARLIQMIPPQPGYLFVGLPEMPELYPLGLYTLSEDGQYLTAPRTGTRYPNETYEETEELVVTNRKGDTVRIPYYEDSNGQKYFITAHLWYLQKTRVLAQTKTLATTDPLGAARVLDALAEAFDGYNPTVDRVEGSRQVNLSYSLDAGPPYAYWGGIWDRWWYDHMRRVSSLFEAYDMIRGTNAFELLSTELGYDVERRVVEELFVPSMEYGLTYLNRYSNMSFEIWYGLAMAGIKLDKPDYVHRVLESVDRFISNLYLSDGFWQEITLSYHDQTIREMEAVFQLLQGYSDPPGYISPRTGVRYDSLDLGSSYPLIAKARQMSPKTAYPDGKLLPIMDTWASSMAQPQPGPEDGGPLLLPAAKIGRLADGSGADQMQVVLAYQPKYGHVHFDSLQLNLYAERQEMLPDLGYSHNTNFRWYTLSTMSHNTVLVDGANSLSSGDARHGGNVRSYVADGGLFQAMRADYDSAYGVTTEYSREPWFIPFGQGGTGEGYVVDLFRVSGGSRHEYMLQGDANRDATMRTALSLTDYGPYLLPPGTNVTEPVSNSDSGQADGHYPGYIYVKSVKEADLQGQDDYTVLLETEQSNLAITGLLEDGDQALYLGRSPSLRSTRLYGTTMDNNDEAMKYDLPKLVHRREGTNLQSTFATVMEPYSERRKLEGMERLALPDGPEGAVALRVVYGDTTDLIFSNPHHPDQPVTAAGVTMIGEMGMVRLIDGEVQEMSLLGGTTLRYGDRVLYGEGTWTGVITDTMRVAAGDSYDALVVEGEVPSEAAGRTVIIEHPDGSTTGLVIATVERIGEQTVLRLRDEEPGFVFLPDGSSQQTHYPGKKWQAEGSHAFRISSVVTGSGVAYIDALVGISLEADKMALLSGESVSVAVYGYTTAGGKELLAEAPVVWSSSSEAVVQMNSSGMATAVSPGTVVLTAEMESAGRTLRAQLPLSVQAYTPGLSEPPVLSSLHEPAVSGEAQALLFSSDTAGAAWRDQISGVALNGVPLAASNYSVQSDRIVLDSSVIDPGIQLATVQAESYRDAAVGWEAAAPGSLLGLSVSPGALAPVFSPDANSYAVSVSGSVTSLDVLASVYSPGAYWTVNGQVYTGTGMLSVPLAGELTLLAIESSVPGEEPIHYTVQVHRPATAPGVGTIAGAVLDDLNQPVLGVEVRVSGYGGEIATVTDASGQFLLAGVPEGMRWVAAIDSRYQTVSAALEVEAGQQAMTVLRLEQLLPPHIEGAPAIGALRGQSVEATSTSDGWLYLVPVGTPRTASALADVIASSVGGQVYGVRTAVTAGVPGALDTSELADGSYILAAVSSRQEQVSRPWPLLLLASAEREIDNSSPDPVYSGVWTTFTNAAYAGGTQVMSREAGASVEVTFYGSGVRWIADRHTARGKANVYVNGVLEGTIDSYNPTVLYRQTLFEKTGLPEGVHRLRIEVLGERSAGASNTYVAFDALEAIQPTFAITLHTPGPLAAGEDVSATSPRNGTLALVPHDTPYSAGAIAAAAATVGRATPATGGVPAELDTTGLATGTYNLYALDAFGLLSEAGVTIQVIDASAQPARIEETHGQVRYGGSWQSLNNAAYSGGTMRIARDPGAYVEVVFYGSEAVWLADKHTARGIGKLYLDGAYVTDIDFYRSSVLYQQPLWTSGTLTEGIHVLRLETTGEKNPSASNTYISFDALLVE